MHARYLLAISWVFLCLTVCRGALPAGGGSDAVDPELSARAVADLMRSDTIVRLEILYFPKEMETLTRMTPQSLETQCWYRIAVEQFQWSAVRSDLISALEGCFVQPAAREPDCRWGCIFYDARSNRLLSIFSDGRGSVGMINGTPVTGISPLVGVLESRCSRLWEGKVLYSPLAD
jgi:hypothetical protein